MAWELRIVELSSKEMVEHNVRALSLDGWEPFAGGHTSEQRIHPNRNEFSYRSEIWWVMLRRQKAAE